MILNKLFGDCDRIKIIEELCSNWGVFLDITDLANMSDVDRGIIYEKHIKPLIDLGLVEKISIYSDEEKLEKYRLKLDHEACLALMIIDTNLYMKTLEDHILNDFIEEKWKNE